MINRLTAHEFLFTSDKRYLGDYGGRGSGKSVAASQAFIYRAIQSTNAAMVVRKVARTNRLSTFPRIVQELSDMGILSHCRVNKTELTITLPNGAPIYFIGMDDPEKTKSIEKPWLAWIEEADSLSAADFDAVDFSLRQGGDTIILTFNPPPTVPGVSHWIKQRFIDGSDPDCEFHKTTYKDNLRFLPDKYIDRLERLEKENPELYKMWALGEFVGLSGAIFQNWGVVDKIPDDAQFIGYGLDFGFSVDPAALIASYRYNGEFYHEEIIYQTNLTNSDLIKEMRRLNVSGDIVADSAEPKSIEELRRAGFQVRKATKGPDSIRAGIDYLRGFRHNVTQDSAGLIREFGSYVWQTDKAGNQKPKPIDDFNHGIDAIRYRCYKKEQAARVADFSASAIGV